MKRRLFLGTAVAAVLCAVVFLRVRARSDEAAPEAGTAPTVSVVEAAPVTISSELSLSAEFRPFQEVDVHAKVAGYVKAIYVDVGDRVKANQTLALLEIPEAEAELKEADASVRRSAEEINRLKSEVARAKSLYEATHASTTRLQEVSRQRPTLVAQQEIDDAIAKDRSAEAQVSVSQAALAAAQEQLSVSSAAREKAATLNSYARIVAPFDGVITKRYADTGAMIQAGTSSSTQAMPVVRVAQDRKLRLVIPVPESAVPQVKLGAAVEVRVEALRRSFTGTITRFSRSVDTATRTMETEVDLDNREGLLVPGMFASAVLVTEHKDVPVSVPVEAVRRNGAAATTLVVNAQNTIERRSLTLGLEDPKRVEIVSGLRAGERVVIGSESSFHPGETVTPHNTGDAKSGGKR